MLTYKRIIAYGAGLWVVLVAASLLLRVYETGDSPLFESLKFLVLAIATVGLATLYLKKAKSVTTAEGFVVGLSWLIIVVLLDMVLYLLGMFNLGLDAYFKDVVSSYLIMPIVTTIIMSQLKVK